MPHFRVTNLYIIAEESPTGERLEKGDVFQATSGWAEKRKGCPIFEPITVDEYKAAQGAADKVGSHALGHADTDPADDDAEDLPDAPVIPADYYDLKKLAYKTAKERGDELESDGGDYLRAYLKEALAQ